MKKIDRQNIFNKFDGKCAYCGCELVKGWHVDEIEPCNRKRKFIPAHWDDKTKPICNNEADYKNPMFRQWVEGKWMADGFKHPERLHIDNQFPACASCNINKHSMSLEHFRKMIGHFINTLNGNSTQYKLAKRYGLIEETGKEVVFYFETFKI